MFTLNLSNGLAFSPALVILGAATANLSLGGGCNLLVESPSTLVRFLSGSGSDAFSFGVPAAIPAGIDLMTQYLVFDPAGAFSGVASLSNGLRLQAGH